MNTLINKVVLQDIREFYNRIDMVSTAKVMLLTRFRGYVLPDWSKEWFLRNVLLDLRGILQAKVIQYTRRLEGCLMQHDTQVFYSLCLFHVATCAGYAQCLSCEHYNTARRIWAHCHGNKRRQRVFARNFRIIRAYLSMQDALEVIIGQVAKKNKLGLNALLENMYTNELSAIWTKAFYTKNNVMEPDFMLNKEKRGKGL